MSKLTPGRRPLGEDEFLTLAVRFLEDAVDEQDRLALEAELFASRQRRDQFVELCMQRGELSESLLGSAPAIDDDERGGAGLRRGDIAAILREEEYGLGAPPPLWGPTQLWMGGIGLGFAILLLVGWFGWKNWNASTQVARGFDPFLSPQYIATLTGAANAKWGESTVATDVNARLVSGRMELASGSAELTFDSGARVVIEGPASLVLHSDKGGFLERGRLVARVPERAKGFAIKTATTQIIDLGTEFGVAVEKSGEVLVQVFQGRVQVESTGLKPGEAGTRQLVMAGSALRHRSAEEEWETAAYDSDAYLRRLPGEINRYPESLVGYWSFDEQGGPMLDGVGWNDGWARGGAARTTGLVGAGAARFENLPGQRVDLGAGSGKFYFSDGITIEALFVSQWNSMWLDYDEIFRKEDREQRVLLSFQHDSNVQQAALPTVPIGPCLSFGLNVAGIYSELDVPLDGEEGRPSLAELTDGRMHHVAATYDAATGVKSLYVDGTLRMSVTLSGAILSGGSSPAMIGNMETNTEPFQGTIDEVAIYHAALPADVIADHWRRAQAGQSYFHD